ncbi:nitrate- and nitrite sensing domain-containing protein [Streptomyces sp. N2-109]|uniref:histidine kinase n=1 Tax=Streptomyces gossypii TaxID=2883101 RepID=A0ABT2JXL3_9ACTN|nr:sensor histidine kinase [Streptomyces gossypii]MCT2592625.1 nitrate- and nitrite sensing domain-containing protein [Streptomyces gossypii]
MQGRFKRDGSAAGDPELRGSTNRGSSPQRAHGSGPSAAAQDSGSSKSKGAKGAKGDGGEGSKTPKDKVPTGPGSRLALRNWRISTRLVSLLALPVVAATTLGGLRISSSLDNVEQLDNMQLLTEMTEHATELAAALQEERDKSAGPLISSGNDKDDAVVATREDTDRARQAFHEHTGDINSDDKVMSGVQTTVVDITRQLNDIKGIREAAYNNEEYTSQTVDRYSRLIESLLSLSLDMAQATSNPEMIQSTRALAAFSSAKEFASVQRAIISAGLARKDGPDLSQTDRLYASTAMSSEDAKLTTFGKIQEEGAAELLKPLDGGIVNITAADTYRDRVLKSADGIKREQRSYMDWYDQDKTKIDEMGKIEDTLLTEMEQQARKLRSEAQRDAIINGVVIFLVLGISLVGAFVVARSMVRSLRRLQDTAQDVARRRLPELVKQMSEAEPQDIDTSVESVGVHSRDEIGKVASAFDDVHSEAVRLAGEQALLRGNVNAMFTNLSRRSQGLIQRQLSLISELESREADPDQLSSLFKLDHLATRMRRNGENLLVLAGEEPGRRWTRPVPLVDVLRAAASEVEQYERIELSSVPTTEVAGRVVNDLVHLLAELLENATSFSSPQTKVKVTGHALPDGRVLVEIHDTGIGLSPEDLSAINERLANPPTVDVSVSRRMGLFVVGRLSLRHGIRIQLRPSDSGGTTGLVMLPVDVAQGAAQSGAAGPKGKPGAAPPGVASNASGAPKGPGLAAALQREPRSAGAAATTRLGAVPPRGQVGGGNQRPALPGSSGEAGGQHRSNGLPTRPTGAGSTPPGGDRGGTATDFFGSRSGGRPVGAPRQDTPANGLGAGQPPAAPPLPTRSGPAGESPSRPQHGPGDTGEFPQPPFTSQAPPAPPAGAASRGGPGDTAEFDRPDFNGPPPAGVPGSADRAAEQARPSWASPEETPRGHDDAETSGEYARPGYPEQSPQDTGAYPRPGYPEQNRQDTGEYASPGYPEQVRPEQGPQDTGEFQQFGQPALPAPTGRVPQPQHTGEFAIPEAPAPAPQRDLEFGIPAGPPAAADTPTPIFESMESNWFRGSGSSQQRSVQPEPAPNSDDQQQPPQAHTQRPGPASATPAMPQREPARGTLGNGDGFGTGTPREAGANWGSPPNDESWRQAEQLRQPAAGGVTTSGLPRRVPRANLVAGTAQEQSSAQSGPQVSRAPDDVRGRLTNLRRGIRQGRQATDGHDIGPTYQQER